MNQQKPPHPFFFYISIFIFEILSLKEQQLFKGFAIFENLGGFRGRRLRILSQKCGIQMALNE
ncbi:hypothetical protein BpHYR1_027793 [Brachionus plicatilis]|uniref:Uncharacterized protein n=1 Tax=Brachionus plicatilis TaxID=10195 RepID=A0A3M7RUA1_BRAPC|nr:hypothetical protein BpHYR1_027793 [Brachionus plicatilis]